MSYWTWTTLVSILILKLKDHLIPNILTPRLIRLTKRCRRSDYCYANGPKINIAVSPNDMPLSLHRMDIIGALCNFLFWDFCITIVTAYTFFGQSNQMRCQHVRN